MLNERVKELLEYLNVLSQVQGAGHYVNEEIKEAVKELRLELGLEKKKQDTLKASRFLVFEAKLGGKTSFIQDTVFRAFEENERVEFLVEKDQLNEVEKAIEVLRGMKPSKQAYINEEIELYSVIIK
jgi:hypothetical protein